MSNLTYSNTSPSCASNLFGVSSLLASNAESPLAYMFSSALLRRHLLDDQRAILAVYWAAENKKQGQRTDLTSPPRGGEVSPKLGPTAKEALERFNVPRKKFDDANWVVKLEFQHHVVLKLTQTILTSPARKPWNASTCPLP